MAVPNYAIWPTVTEVYALLTGANITPTLASSSAIADAFLQEAVQTIGKTTQRQFLPGSAGEIRYYDGSGTGRQIVDEFIDVSAVQFLVYPQAAGIDIQYWYEQSRNGYPNTVLQIFQGPANTNYGYVASFPQGRSNIKVTGQFGYATTIPAPIWMAAVKLAAAGIAASNSLSAQGKLTKWVDGDAAEDYGSEMPGDVAGWIDDVKRACKLYTRPVRERRMRQEKVLY